MNYKETWGIEFQRIFDFFAGQPDIDYAGDGMFHYKNCHIYIKQLPDSQIGSLKLPKTSLEIDGAETDAKTIYQRFFLRFLSAGG